MNIAVIGRGNVGGGLAERWRTAGHDVQELGKDGGDVSSADVLVVAVPAGAIADAFAKVTGAEGKVTIDTTNAIGGRPDGFESMTRRRRRARRDGATDRGCRSRAGARRRHRSRAGLVFYRIENA
jgi:predicted dinucleotide-binding enzyme